MKKTDIKEMTKEQRLAHLVMLTNTYKSLMVYDIATENEFGAEMWKKSFVDTCRILRSFIIMRGLGVDIWYYIK